jgi:Family of unknown function (DUF6659)
LVSIEEVVKRNRNVRFAAIIGPGGKILKGGMKPNRESLEPSSKAEQLYLQWTTMHKMGTDWNKYLGRRTYLLDKREHVNIYTFNVDKDHILLVSTDPVSASTLGDQILDLIAKSDAVKKSEKELRP